MYGKRSLGRLERLSWCCVALFVWMTAFPWRRRPRPAILWCWSGRGGWAPEGWWGTCSWSWIGSARDLGSWNKGCLILWSNNRRLHWLRSSHTSIVYIGLCFFPSGWRSFFCCWPGALPWFRWSWGSTRLLFRFGSYCCGRRSGGIFLNCFHSSCSWSGRPCKRVIWTKTRWDLFLVLWLFWWCSFLLKIEKVKKNNTKQNYKFQN